MNFIKKIFDGRIDDSVRLQFQKFGKGEYRDRALIEVKKSGNKHHIKTSSEFANELVKITAEKLGEKKTNVSGAVVSTSDLKNELKYKEIKQFQGVKRYLIDGEMSGKEILGLLEKFPKTFFALSFSFDNEVLKIKPKAPKSGKPGKDDDLPKAGFCSLKTNDQNTAKSFVFEKGDFSRANVGHNFFVTSLEIPEELKKSSDFAKMREESKRIGKVVRKAIIDGKEIISEKEFRV